MGEKTLRFRAAGGGDAVQHHVEQAFGIGVVDSAPRQGGVPGVGAEFAARGDGDADALSGFEHFAAAREGFVVDDARGVQARPPGTVGGFRGGVGAEGIDAVDVVVHFSGGGGAKAGGAVGGEFLLQGLEAGGGGVPGEGEGPEFGGGHTPPRARRMSSPGVWTVTGR